MLAMTLCWCPNDRGGGIIVLMTVFLILATFKIFNVKNQPYPK